mmetsp:Transcript_73101/g.144988  ORF Transcript_73101/g.144988 Transcript_73101/m.144988 type:complete len:200 (+) Transcript_73101:1-600(+)
MARDVTTSAVTSTGRHSLPEQTTVVATMAAASLPLVSFSCRCGHLCVPAIAIRVDCILHRVRGYRPARCLCSVATMKISILTFVECSSLEWKKCSLWPTAVEAEAVQIHYVRALQNGASDVSTPVRLAQARGLRRRCYCALGRSLTSALGGSPCLRNAAIARALGSVNNSVVKKTTCFMLFPRQSQHSFAAAGFCSGGV